MMLLAAIYADIFGGNTDCLARPANGPAMHPDKRAAFHRAFFARQEKVNRARGNHAIGFDMGVKTAPANIARQTQVHIRVLRAWHFLKDKRVDIGVFLNQFLHGSD